MVMSTVVGNVGIRNMFYHTNFGGEGSDPSTEADRDLFSLSVKTRFAQPRTRPTLHNFINIGAPLATARSL